MKILARLSALGAASAALILGMFSLAHASLPARGAAQEATPTSVYDELTTEGEFRQPTPTPTSIPDLTSAQCFECHSAPDQVMMLPSGESLYLTLDAEAFAASGHGREDVQCTDCHADITAYPHPPLAEQNLRQVAANFSVTCQNCHEDQAAEQLDSIHVQLRALGNEAAAVCADCHNPHYTSAPAEPRGKIASTCARCHSGIAQDYRQSVHGAGLVYGDNPDVPACTDCHGVHSIPDPRTTEFLLRSPQLCAGCHADPEKMAPYGLNTDVLDTYIADFHGTTVILFQRQSPDQLPNTPLCIDCHGIHNIKPAGDANSSVMKENLLATCQKCHPNATANFSDAWLSHYSPSPDRNPLVYYVNGFYRILIPGLIGGMALLVVTDAGRRFARRNGPGQKPKGDAE